MQLSHAIVAQRDLFSFPLTLFGEQVEVAAVIGISKWGKSMIDVVSKTSQVWLRLINF